MTTRSCPNWPDLMEIAPELQFKHYTINEAKLPSEVLIAVGGLPLDDTEICCDLEHHVFYAAHTHAQVGDALRESHWYELTEWARGGPGTGRPAA